MTAAVPFLKVAGAAISVASAFQSYKTSREGVGDIKAEANKGPDPEVAQRQAEMKAGVERRKKMEKRMRQGAGTSMLAETEYKPGAKL